ncbi:MAG: lactate racemase domain-containing protein [Anaerolineales bacterium]|nr:lactate racemase domain-containing protein [Anaerolineales bacterium]
MFAQAQAPKNKVLSQEEVIQAFTGGLEKQFSGQKVVVIIPDHTRSIPLAELFRLLVNVLRDVGKIDFLVALGTHPPLSEEQLCKLVGISQEERISEFRHIGLFNHSWNSPDTLIEVGKLSESRIKEIAGPFWHPTLGGDIPVTINQIIFQYDHILILGPTSPHEVAGFSGGAKYLFPGISGMKMINATHWMGALAGVGSTIGIKHTPVRNMIHAAAETVPIPITLIGLVVNEEGLDGVFIGDVYEAWSAAADLSSKCHIKWFDKPFKRVLSQALPMYDELWTCAKAFYKVEPVVGDGGEVIIYAPHLNYVSRTHGKYIYEVGYHVLEYFLSQWDRFEHIPLGVLAHSTHVRGDGKYKDGIESPRVKATLASQISEEDCRKLGLGYLDPGEVDITQWQNREDEGILFVPKAGEILYRLYQE